MTDEELNDEILNFASIGKNTFLRMEGEYQLDSRYDIFADNELFKKKDYDTIEITREVCEYKPDGIWYHGTTSKNYDKMRKEGLRRGQTIFCNPYLEKRRACTDAVYLSKNKDIAEWYALEVSSVQGGKPMIVKVDIDKDEYPDISYDEDIDASIPLHMIDNKYECCVLPSQKKIKEY